MTFSLTAHEVFASLIKDLYAQKRISNEIYHKLNGLNRSRNVKSLMTYLKTLESCTLYHDIDQTRILRQLRAIFSKNESYRSAGSELVALTTFLEGERSCAAINERLDSMVDYIFDVDSPFEKMRNYISRVLGPFDLFLNSLEKHLKLSSGASVNSSRRRSSLPRKISRTVETTRYGYNLYKALYGDQIRCKETYTNRVTFVPKNYQTDRTIACEPRHSMPLQLAFDNYCKDRLRRKAGIDLSDQSLNQLASFKGSLDGSLCTIDLKGASDSVSYNIVAALLPDDWFEYLNGIRSKFYRIAIGEDVISGCYQKFSSMGNGSTFPLETLIFSAVVHAVGSKTNIVYGDDIICDDIAYSDVVDLLALCGFTVNDEKSFHGRTPFRESCGTDWYKGIDVTPFYMRTDIVQKKKRLTLHQKADLCHIVNGLRRVAFGPHTLRLCDKIISTCNLLEGEYNEDTRSCVFVINPRYRYSGSVKTHRAYTSITKNRFVTNSLIYLYALHGMFYKQDLDNFTDNAQYEYISDKIVVMERVASFGGPTASAPGWVPSRLRSS